MIALLEDSQMPVQLRTQPQRQTGAGRPISWFVDEQVSSGVWREEEIPPEVLGLTRPIKVFRAPRKTSFIMYDWHGDKQTFCPPMWWDLAIGSGARMQVLLLNAHSPDQT